MSVERIVGGAKWALLSMGLAVSTAQAGLWMEQVTTHFSDPLFSQPERLSTAQAMPGDASPLDCDASVPTQKLSLTEAIQLALCRHPQIRVAAASIRRQAAQLGESRAAYLPVISMGASQQRQVAQQPDSQFTVQTDRKTTSHFVTLTWRLLDGGGRHANHSMARTLLDAAVATHDAELQRLFSLVTAAYFDAQTARANHDFRATSEGLARQTLDASKRLEARGMGSQSQTLQAKVALAKAELERVRARGVHEKSLLALQVTMALPASQWAERSWDIEEDFDESADDLQQALSEWVTLATRQHPSLRAARLEADAARDRLRIVQSEGLPTLDFTQSRYVNGRPNQGLSSSRSRETVTGVTLNIPLFEGFSRTYKVSAARAQIDIQEAELSRLEAQVLSEIAKAHAEASAALQNLQSSTALLDASREALAHVRRKFEAGVADISEMLQVQASLADAQQERIRAVSEWRSARLRLLANAGVAGLAAL